MELFYDPILQRHLCALIIILIALFFLKHQMKKITARYQPGNHEIKSHTIPKK